MKLCFVLAFLAFTVAAILFAVSKDANVHRVALALVAAGLALTTLPTAFDIH